MRRVLYMMGILTDSDVEWLAVNGKQTLVKASTVLIREGTPIDCIYIVLDGELSVVREQTGNTIATLVCGEKVGEISFVDSRPPSTSVIAPRDSWLLAIDRAGLKQKLAEDPPFASRFYQAVGAFLADRLRASVGQLGYGARKESTDADELDDTWIENISFAASRFDQLLKRLGVGTTA